MIQLKIYKAIESYNALKILKIHDMNTLQKLLWSIVLIFTASFIQTANALQQHQRIIDSLKKAVVIENVDTNKVKLLLKIGIQYSDIIADTALYYFNEALEIAENIKEKEFIAESLIHCGNSHRQNGSPDLAIEYFGRALKISEETGDKKKQATCYVNIGIVSIEQGSYDKAIEYCLKSLDISKEIHYKEGLSLTYISLGRIYFYQGFYEEALGYYLKSLKIYEELGDKAGLSDCYNNIGLVHSEQKSYDKAIEYLQKALTIREELGRKRGISICYNNLGNVFFRQGSYHKAIEYYNKALTLFKDIGNIRGIAGCYHNLGVSYRELGSFEKAGEFYLKANKIYEEIGDKMNLAYTDVSITNLNISLADSVAKTESQRIKYLNQAITYGNKAIVYVRKMNILPLMKEVTYLLMTAYNKLGNYKKAIEFAGILISTQDSLFAEDKTKAIQEMSTKYETEKKQQQIELQESQLIAKDARIAQQKTFRNALIGGLGAIVLVVIVIAYAYIQKRKDNKKIIEQNAKILQTNDELKQLNDITNRQYDELKQLNEITNRQKDEIVSSIQYAQRIQSAILPPEIYITELLNENFLFYKPKDIVSGDFYWITKVNHYIILVSADCTGHGVPGAFMSMLGISYLNEIVQRREITQANQVLNELRKLIKHSLRQTGNSKESRDGIDIALCVIDTNKSIMQYSGAYSPLYIISNINGESVLREFKADLMPVGVHVSSDQSFTNHEVQLEIGDTFYISTDGFIDQLGGPNSTRFGSKKFKKLLLDIHDQPLYEQKEILEQTLKDWMSGHPQRDDILVIGARI